MNNTQAGRLHSSLRLAALAATAVLMAACGSTGSVVKSTNAAYGASPDPVEVRFPEPDSAWLKGGSFVDVDQLRRIGRGMTKNQVRELISYPHFGEGLFGPTEWDYLFNFRTGKGDEFVTCQYKVVFKDGVSDQFYWRDPACADHLKPKVSEVVRPVVAAAPERFQLGADALFAFDKSGEGDILPEGRRQLDDLAARLKGAYRRLDSITIVGHTDRLGSEAYNRRLSMARAATVRDYLAARGLPQGALRAHGVGEAQPVVQCADNQPRAALIACLQPNRRVELEVRGER
ncbi:OmpA family protein [Xenophilus sp.]|mgnify:CR=1 FL=1|uniref:OmpA family protein n=1 Tax=Xenophilus sp. TaxID=1873499 RepID=UPI0037DCC718